MGFDVQDSNDDAWVGVREGFHNDTQETVQEFIVQDKEAGERLHFGVNLDGDQIFDTEWHGGPPGPA